jgi:signal transduction histidine kinase
LPMEPVDLGKLVRDLTETYPDLLPERAEITIEGELPVVLGNESLLTQCFSNLLGNAVKFVAPGTKPYVRIWAEPGRMEGVMDKWIHESEPSNRNAPEPSPHLSTNPLIHSSNPKCVRIWVEDKGIGIPKEAQYRLFGMFQKLDGHYEGTGIGLAIVRKVVQRMGGGAGVESEEGRGSRFWVDLRRAGN